MFDTIAIEKMYEELMAKQRAAINNTLIEIKLLDFQNNKIDTIIKEIENEIGRPVFEDWHFRGVGKILGILNAIRQNPKSRDKLMEITGITSSYIDFYNQYGGQLPYLDKKTNSINYGFPMNEQKMREFLPLIGNLLGVIVNEEKLIDITEEHFNAQATRIIENLENTEKFNEQIKLDSKNINEDEDD